MGGGFGGTGYSGFAYAAANATEALRQHQAFRLEMIKMQQQQQQWERAMALQEREAGAAAAYRADTLAAAETRHQDQVAKDEARLALDKKKQRELEKQAREEDRDRDKDRRAGKKQARHVRRMDKAALKIEEEKLDILKTRADSEKIYRSDQSRNELKKEYQSAYSKAYSDSISVLKAQWGELTPEFYDQARKQARRAAGDAIGPFIDTYNSQNPETPINLNEIELTEEDEAELTEAIEQYSTKQAEVALSEIMTSPYGKDELIQAAKTGQLDSVTKDSISRVANSESELADFAGYIIRLTEGEDPGKTMKLLHSGGKAMTVGDYLSVFPKAIGMARDNVWESSDKLDNAIDYYLNVPRTSRGSGREPTMTKEEWDASRR